MPLSSKLCFVACRTEQDEPNPTKLELRRQVRAQAGAWVRGFFSFRQDVETSSPKVTGHHQHLIRRLIAEPELFTIGWDETLLDSSAQRRPIVNNSAAAVLAV